MFVVSTEVVCSRTFGYSVGSSSFHPPSSLFTSLTLDGIEKDGGERCDH